mmetsp:Transcript_22307/g.68657  ORF Transcript_22307/g.68657 Transcript_22307/m.68657 type:complete len:485 (+) Transcript_22307:36-1490(+)
MFAALQEFAWYSWSWSVPYEVVEEQETEERFKRLNEWFEAEGGRGSGRARYIDAEKRGGLFATVPVGRGEAYLEIPAHVIQGKRTALASRRGPALSRTYENAKTLLDSFPKKQDDSLPFGVLLCTYLVSDAAPRAFVDALPRNFDNHPLLWPLQDDGTAWSAFHRDTVDALRFFVALCRAARDRELPEVSRERLVWAFLTWTTRCISLYHPATGDDELAFVPLIDMTNCAACLENANCSRTVLEDGRAAVIRTPVALAEGSEILENYGWSNFDYFACHGFFHATENAFVCRPLRVPASSTLLAALVGPGGVWVPRLCEDMRFFCASSSHHDDDDTATDTTFKTSWPFDFFNAEWQSDRNHAFLVAVALEVGGSDDSAASTHDLGRWLAKKASLLQVSNAWRRLAAIATDEVKALRAASSAHRHDNGNSTSANRHTTPLSPENRARLLAFYDTQIRLGDHLVTTFHARAFSCFDPPPYSSSSAGV